MLCGLSPTVKCGHHYRDCKKHFDPLITLKSSQQDALDKTANRQRNGNLFKQHWPLGREPLNLADQYDRPIAAVNVESNVIQAWQHIKLARLAVLFVR